MKYCGEYEEGLAVHSVIGEIVDAKFEDYETLFKLEGCDIWFKSNQMKPHKENKKKVTIPLDYVIGHTRYGDAEAII